MKLKKITAIVIAATMAMSSLVGCGKDEGKNNESNKASVFDLLKEESDNATISLDFNYSEDESKTTGNLVFLQNKDDFCLDTIKLSEEGGEAIELNKLLSGSKDAIYLNIGTFAESISSEDSMGGSIASILLLIFQNVEYLKIEIPKTEDLSTKEIKDEFIKNLEASISKAGFNFVVSEDGKTFTLKVNSVEGFKKIVKELYTQMKASSDVYAAYIEKSNNSLSNDSVKDYVKEQTNGIFEEVAKYFEVTLTDKNKETLQTNLNKWVEENVDISTKQMTKEEAKKQFEEIIDEKIVELEESTSEEDIKTMEVTFVVTDTEDGMVVTINAISEDGDGVKTNGTLELTIKNGNAKVTFPEKSTELKEIVGNIMTLVDSFGILGDIKEGLKGADETTIDEFINSLFNDALESGSDDEWEDEDFEEDLYNSL